MPESPDFDEIGRVLADEAGYSGDDVARRVAASISQQLRLVWNARGAADLAAFRAIGNSSPQDIVRALRTLDR
jgi:hypothetical protein